MAGILDLLNSPIGQTVLQGLSQETNEPKDKTAAVLNMALPVLLSAMKNNASTTQGAQSLLNALNNDHDGSILNNLTDLFQGGVNQYVTNDGAGIIKHVLGDSQSQVTQAISKNSGVDPQTVMRILQIAAPIVLGYLGQQTRQNNISSQNGIADLLGNLIGGGQNNQKKDLLTTLLDGNGDGNIIDDVAGMLGNFFKK